MSAKFSHEDFRHSMLAKLRDWGIDLKSEEGKAIMRRVSTLAWQRGRWTGDKAFQVLALIEDILTLVKGTS